MKIFVKMFLATIVASGGLSGYSLTIGKDTIIGMQTMKTIDTIKGFAEAGLAEFDLVSTGKATELVEAPYQKTLDACMAAMFFEKEGHHFSQSKWSSQSVPYQFRGLELIGPKGQMLNQIDRAKGIEERITFEFYVEAFRSYDKSEGWKSWEVSRPPNLDSITLVLHQGEWKVASSPIKSYNLK